MHGLTPPRRVTAACCFFGVFVCRAPSALLEDFERDEVVVPVEEVDPVVGVVPPVGVVVPVDVVVAEDNHVGYLE